MSICTKLGFSKTFFFDAVFLFIIFYIIFDISSDSENPTVPEINNKSKKIERPLLYIENNKYLDFEGFDNNVGDVEYIVPNVIHYVNLNRSEISYEQYTSILSVIHFQHPTHIFIHLAQDTNMNGKYWNLLLNNEKINKLIKLKQLNYKDTIFDVKVLHFKHVVEFVRLDVLMHYGGIYLDNDVILAGDLDKFRRFETTILNGSSSINDKIIIANKNSRFLKAYSDSYRYFFLFLFNFSEKY